MKPVTPNYAEMGSSTGFKKRTIGRPSSTLSTEKEYLKSIDISQSQSIISSLLKNQLSAIQQDINIIDMDKKIRFGEGGLEKSYVTLLKKWVREAQNTSDKQEDQIKILKYLNVDNLSAGFKKLWKLVSILDNMIQKSTELQVVTFLKYDDLFTSICKDYTPVTKKLNNINQNFTVGGFSVTQIMIERIQDLFSLVSKLKKSTGSTLANETDDLINKLQAENAKLNSYLNSMTEQLSKSKIKQPLTSKSNNANDGKVEKVVLDKVCSEIAQKYTVQLEECNKKIQDLLNEESKLKIQIQVLHGKQQMLLSDLKEAKSKSTSRSSSNNYEAALMEELQSMKSGYEYKINRLTNDFTARQRELRRKQNDYRIENQKVRFERALLLKKYDLMK